MSSHADMPEIPKEVIEHKPGIDPLYKQSSKKREDILQKGMKPSGRKSINYLKHGSLD
jgi:hypothetical protein